MLPAPANQSSYLDDGPLAALTANLASLWSPPRRLPLSQWAEENIVLSPEYSARSSNLRLFGWQRAMLDAFTDQTVREVVYMTATQLIKSLAVQCAIAYVVCEDPGPILLLEPKEDAASAFSKRRLTPMIRDCVCLHGKLTDSRNTGTSTLLSKDFPGGNLLIVSANTPVDVAQHTIRYVMCDEPDKYKASAGKEGDPMDLAWARAATFQSRRKRIIACSPTVAGASRIGTAYENSDQRKPWVACPKCKERQILKFFRDGGGGGVWFDSSLSKEKAAASARYECGKCHERWSDLERIQACEDVEWRASRDFNGIAGFWISHLYSPWQSLSDIVRHFLEVKNDRQRYQVFVNTVLAELWQESGETPDHIRLFNRTESYPFGSDAVIPKRGLFLTAAVDVQEEPPRLEVEVKAWGRNRENWSMDYQVIQAFDPSSNQALPVTSREVWDKLDRDVLQRYWKHESGHLLSIRVMLIDTGKRPKPVYEFARRHLQMSYSPAGIRLPGVRVVIPIKGNADDLRILSRVSKEDAAHRRQGTRIVSVGTICAKTEIYDLLRNVVNITNGTLSGAVVPQCYHFPKYDLSYFESLTAEVRIVKENGEVVFEKRRARNEVLDAAVYGRAGAAIVGIDRFTEAQWRQLEQALEGPVLIQTVSPVVLPVDPSQSSVTVSSVQSLVPALPSAPTARATRGTFI